jgi:hypothetical protein
MPHHAPASRRAVDPDERVLAMLGARSFVRGNGVATEPLMPARTSQLQ